MAFWTCYEDRVSIEHSHDFDEHMICVSGQYTVFMIGEEFVLNPGDEIFIPKGTLQGGRCSAGTRTLIIMKKTVIGIALLISATLADLGILISASILANGLTEWNSDSGKLWTAITENKLMFPFVLAKILFVVAVIIIFIEYFDKKSNLPRIGKIK